MVEKRAIARHGGEGGQGENDRHFVLFYAFAGGEWVAKMAEEGRHSTIRSDFI